jgi:hypothetical protein
VDRVTVTPVPQVLILCSDSRVGRSHSRSEDAT